MKKAVIFYQSKTGTTKNYAKEIGDYLQAKQIDTSYLPVDEYHEELLQKADYVLTGCWTKGLLVVLQKPDEVWIDFAKKLKVSKNAKVALFATYKVRTGGMFKNMAKQIKSTSNTSFPNLKSRDGKLSGKDKLVLDGFIEN